MNKKITLGGLEAFLMRVADQLRKSMEANEYKEYIFGLLFLKRMSDVFEEKREALRKEYKHLPKEVQETLLEDRTTYGETFFIPKRARWNEGWYDAENNKEIPALRDLHYEIGSMLNKALIAIEEANSDVLQGIFKDRIDFNRKSVDGTPVVKDADYRLMIEEFNNFPPLLNSNFEFPDLLGAAYEFILKYFADNSGKKGGEFYTPNTVVRLLVRLLQVDEGMSVYDPTVGSGGMLIQSYQYIEEEGKNPRNLELYGQDNKDSVVAICKMNMIFHDISGSHIKFGDTLLHPQHTKKGRLMTFDRVIANPPFSQNYTTQDMQFKERFCYGWLPENNKKADLMFVQHMLASCNERGRVVVVMPHGVLFRGQKEQAVRKAMLNPQVDVLEGVISLPPQLFYGTPIPACVMIFSKRKDDKMRHKVFFINADREYKEGKKQNSLRPEDIEKISYVYINKIEIPSYSRLVDLSEIAPDDSSDCTLNIRKYVDNTPPSEPQDVHAHLVGGVPDSEIKTINAQLASKMHFNAFSLFADDEQQCYKHFKIQSKDAISGLIKNNSEVMGVINELHTRLTTWWEETSNEFAAIAGNTRTILPKVRSNLMHSMKEALLPVGLLDQYQIAGIFVNWWDGVKYDLKSIMQSGWDIDLVYPDYQQIIVDAFFQKEQSAIELAALRVATAETELSVKVEEALELAEYDNVDDNDEDNKEIKRTPRLAYDALTNAASECESEDEQKQYVDMGNSIKRAEDDLKQAKVELAKLEDDLKLRIELKCYGLEDKISEIGSLQEQTERELESTLGKAVDALDKAGCLMIDDIDTLSVTAINDSLVALKKVIPSQKKKRTADDELTIKRIENVKKDMKPITKQYNKLQGEIEKMNKKIASYEQIMQEIGGKVTVEESKQLILRKHYGIIAGHLERYTDNAKHDVIKACEHLWDKYFVSANDITNEYKTQMGNLNETLRKLKYID